MRKKEKSRSSDRTVSAVAILLAIIGSGLFSSCVVWVLDYTVGVRRKITLEEQSQHNLKRVEIYNALSDSVEDMLGGLESADMKIPELTIHKMFGMLALNAPDDVYLSLKEKFYNGGKPTTLYAKDIRQNLYFALRKSLFGESTGLNKDDIFGNIEFSPIVIREANDGVPLLGDAREGTAKVSRYVNSRKAIR